MSKEWIKRSVAVVVFIISIFVIDLILNRDNSEITMDMPKATLPIVSVVSGDYKINTMYENGVISGFEDGTFKPEESITREQFAAILYRYAQYKGYDVSVGSAADISGFLDSSRVSEYAIPAMKWACGTKLMQGDGTNLTPLATATRVQTAALLQRFCEQIEVEK